MKGGWLGLFGGESQGKALDRVIQEMNAAGYRVSFIVPDRWNPFKRIWALILLIITLGFVGLVQNILVIGERVPLLP
ncbi:MAG TPA: hypothetical protein VJQ83_05285 [Tepidiformaceae bacterium]|nr:hypothetical protein [Tepidiformaceae bacterium]